MSFKMIYRGNVYRIEVTKDKAVVTCLGNYADVSEGREIKA